MVRTPNQSRNITKKDSININHQICIINQQYKYQKMQRDWCHGMSWLGHPCPPFPQTCRVTHALRPCLRGAWPRLHGHPPWGFDGEDDPWRSMEPIPWVRGSAGPNPGSYGIRVALLISSNPWSVLSFNTQLITIATNSVTMVSLHCPPKNAVLIPKWEAESPWFATELCRVLPDHSSTQKNLKELQLRGAWSTSILVKQASPNPKAPQAEENHAACTVQASTSVAILSCWWQVANLITSSCEFTCCIPCCVPNCCASPLIQIVLRAWSPTC